MCQGTTYLLKPADVCWQDALVASGGKVRVAFGDDFGPGYFAAVDELGRLQEVGWIKLPSLQHLSWAGQWLSYASKLRESLKAPALELPVFDKQVRDSGSKP